MKCNLAKTSIFAQSVKFIIITLKFMVVLILSTYIYFSSNPDEKSKIKSFAYLN